ncbi:hypothetical protein [Winogradskyella ludwigii]|uniref:hypothetical protein n=1 Tax=Winogradskyella ludwigii TaxID=2686076 RepID=UPI0015C96209|nr:hypothetical protein [Winogradskyella ludwigii]
MKKHLPLVVLMASALLIIINFIFAEKFDRSFWISTISSLLIIISMVLTIKEQKNK